MTWWRARVVQAACRAVGAGIRQEFKPHLLKMLKHKIPVVRGAACLALAELRASETMPQVFKVFTTDKSRRARYDAWLALTKLALKKDLGHDPKEWEGWWEEQVKEVPEGEPNPWGSTFPRQPKGKYPKWFNMPVGADKIMFVYRESQYKPDADPTAAELIISKQRNGPTGTVPLRFFGDWMRFENFSYGGDEGFDQVLDLLEVGARALSDHIARSRS